MRPFSEQLAMRGLTATLWTGGLPRPLHLDRGTALVVWPSDDPPNHELALIEACADTGLSARALRALLTDVGARDDDVRAEVLHDVARFDGIAQAWHALVVERGVEMGMGAASDQALHRHLERRLAPFTAADGTMRIPTHGVALMAAP